MSGTKGTKESPHALPKTRRGTHGSHHTRTKTATSTATTASRQTDMTSAPSVKDYTESEITQERVSEGVCHIYFGYFLMVSAFVIFVTSMWAFGAESINAKVERMVRYRTLVEGYDSMNFETFKYNLQPNAKVRNKFYLFNLLNKDQWLSGDSSAPNLKEEGPYIYEETLLRAHIDFSEDKETVSYRRLVKQEFIQDEMWLNREDDEIMMVDPVYVKTMYNTESHGLRGEEGIMLTKTFEKLQQLGDFFSKSNGRSMVASLPEEKYYLADQLPGKFFADIIQDLWDTLRGMNGASSSKCGLERWFYKESKKSNGDRSGFLMKWGGDCAPNSGCLSSSNCQDRMNDQGDAILRLLDPLICPNPNDMQDATSWNPVNWIPSEGYQCERGSIGTHIDEISMDYSQKFFNSFYDDAHGSFMDDYFDWDGNGPMGPHRWLDKDDEFQSNIISAFYNILTPQNVEIYNRIRTWVEKVVDDGDFRSRLNSKFSSWDGSNPGGSGGDWTTAAKLQWANGKILSRSSSDIRSFYDTQEMTGEEYLMGGDDRNILYDTRKRTYTGKQSRPFTEFGVWMEREMKDSVGTKVYLDVSEAGALLGFFTSMDDTKFWSLWGTGLNAGVENDDELIQGTSGKVTVKMARAYAYYIRDTFVVPNFDSGGLVVTKKAKEWIKGFLRSDGKDEYGNSLNEGNSLIYEVVEDGDPGSQGGMVGHQEFLHLSDIVNDDIPTGNTNDNEVECQLAAGDLEGACDPYPECRTDSDRPHVVTEAVMDTRTQTETVNTIFDRCEMGTGIEVGEGVGKADLVDAAKWYKKASTYKTGYTDIKERGLIVSAAGLEHIPSDLFGKDVFFKTGGEISWSEATLLYL